MTGATAARRLSALKQFHKFLYVDRYRADDPAAPLEGPRRHRSAPDILSVDEVTRLIDTAREGIDEEARPLGERMQRVSTPRLRPFYASGLRVSELVSLPASAARAREPFVTVRGKGAKERLVPLSEQARAALNVYRALLAKQSPGLATSPFLFPSDAAEAFHAPSLRARSQKRGRRGGAAVSRHQPARAAPRLRQPSAAKWRGPARRAGIARPRRHLDDADLHALLDERIRAMVRDLHPLGD